MHTMQFAHGVLVNAEDHSQQVTKPHADFDPAAEDHVNPHAEKAEKAAAKETKKSEAKTDDKK